jgi:holliday junction DNA helicase RuvA
LIGSLRGRVLKKNPPYLLLEVQGVGYEIEAPMTTFYQLPDVGSEVLLYTHLAVREDALTLFGFSDEQEKTLFRAIIKVNGVGAKLALAILSGISAQGFAQCVQAQDIAALTRVPGIGKKTAQRLIIEMRDKISAHAPNTPAAEGGSPNVLTQSDSTAQEAINALVALGYKPNEANRMVSDLDTQGLCTEDIIRTALQGAAK